MLTSLPASPPLFPPPPLDNGSERLVNTNSCGTRTVCSPAACGLGFVGTKLAAGAAKMDARANEM